jgi:site-specific DNA recombinase
MNEETKNGIIYCRVSSVEQVEGTSLESQERVCHEYAKREGITVLKVFIEKGESAKTADRTEFIKAVSFCSDKKNAVKTFIVYKLDRFARNQSDHISVRQTLKKYGTELRSVTEPINETPMGKMMEGILSTFAEFDNNVRTERCVNGMKERIKQGIWVWQAPLGYYRPTKGSNLVPDPILAPYIRLAFEEYAKGTHTYESLAQFLNDRGFKTPQGNQLIHQVVDKIIKNPLYCGIIKVWGMECKGAFEPIISEDLFYLCQGSKQRNRNVPHLKVNANFPLRKISVCQFCNASLTGSTTTKHRGGKTIQYPYYHHHKQDCSQAMSIPKETFEQLFVEYLNEINPSLEYEQVFKAIVLDIWKNNFKKFDGQNEQARKEIKALENQRQKIFDLHQSGTYSDQEFIDQKTIIGTKIANKKILIHDKAIEEFNMDEALEYCFSYIRNTAKKWIELESNPTHRLRFQKLIFEENIPFSGKKFETAKLTPIYSTYQQYLIDPASLVIPQRIEL